MGLVIDGSDNHTLPLLPAGGGRGVGARFRLGRPTAVARTARNAPTDAEALLWKRLQRAQLGGLKFSRQMPLTGYRPDFLCRSHKLVVELDGSQHADATVYDAARTSKLEALGYRVLRFWNSDLTQNLAGVLEAILNAADGTGRAPTPQPPPACGRGSKA